MMHWHGWQREMITREAEKVRLQTGDMLCKNRRGVLMDCIISPHMAAKAAAVGAARKAGSYYNAAKEAR